MWINLQLLFVPVVVAVVLIELVALWRGDD